MVLQSYAVLLLATWTEIIGSRQNSKVLKNSAVKTNIVCIMSEIKSVLPQKYSKGPHGLGDPDDRSLRKVEVEVVIPKLIRDKARTEKCIPEVAAFEKCCKDAALLMVVKCRPQNSALKECLSSWYNNQEFKQLCTEVYLKERSEYRSTGEKKPIHRMK